MDLKDKCAVITGGTTGIGFATARLFLANGARVTITGQDEARLRAAQASLGAGTDAELVDVRDAAQLARLADSVKARYGALDVLFANAGIAKPTPLLAGQPAAFDEVMAVNVSGVNLTLRALVPLMGRGASVVMNTSWLGEVGTPGLAALSASKAAVRSMTRTLAAELWPLGIRVNAVSPGAIRTPIHGKTGMSAEDAQHFAERIQAAVPMGRFGEAEEVAEAVLFLASDRASYCLGTELAVDGGFAQI
jgi:NAD(P)-dependent dehydrogenase (short-subunit alcohol dehydrogenase family)